MAREDRNEKSDYQLKMVGESAGAYWVKADDDGEDIGLPKSKVDCDRPRKGEICTFSIPLWLAQDRGLC